VWLCAATIEVEITPLQVAMKQKEISRHLIISYYEYNPQASHRELAKLAKCSKGVVHGWQASDKISTEIQPQGTFVLGGDLLEGHRASVYYWGGLSAEQGLESQDQGSFEGGGRSGVQQKGFAQADPGWGQAFWGEAGYARGWVFQLDNAVAHTAEMSKAVLKDRMGGRWVDYWPPSSPDLSWIENVGAWADDRMRRVRGSIRTVAEFREAIASAFRELPLEHCHNYVAGMQKRLSLVQEGEGKATGR